LIWRMILTPPRMIVCGMLCFACWNY